MALGLHREFLEVVFVCPEWQQDKSPLSPDTGGGGGVGGVGGGGGGGGVGGGGVGGGGAFDTALKRQSFPRQLT